MFLLLRIYPPVRPRDRLLTNGGKMREPFTKFCIVLAGVTPHPNFGDGWHQRETRDAGEIGRPGDGEVRRNGRRSRNGPTDEVAG